MNLWDLLIKHKIYILFYRFRSLTNDQMNIIRLVRRLMLLLHNCSEDKVVRGGQRGGGGVEGGGVWVEEGRPQHLQLSCGFFRTEQPRQRSSVKSITDRNRIIKLPLSSTWNVASTRRNTIRLRQTPIMSSPPSHLSFIVWGTNDSRHPAGEFRRRSNDSWENPRCLIYRHAFLHRQKF